MRQSFSLFQSHLDLSHRYWQQLVQPGDIVIDATCGNGHDTLKLAQLALQENLGSVYALDIQEKALTSTQERLAQHLSESIFKRIHFVLGCHSRFPSEILPSSVKLVVYNLGYLPSGDKQLTTQTSTTLKSICYAQDLLMPGGAISLTCYPGHSEGSLEQEAILKYASGLPPQKWSCCHHQWINRSQAPSLLIIQKSFQ